MLAVITGFQKLDKTRPRDVEKTGYPEVIV
ncbi:MAG: hypothetical protein H6Q41_3611 [Deltaproteobacteria bacterium]|jgi:hypothetical protein|nr:hypothetical protein [Deltaproteobacteria bacterium]